MERNNSREFQDRIARIEELIHALDSLPDGNARTQSRELVQILLDLHGAGLNRALEIIFDSGPDGQALIGKLAQDDLLSNLLLLHGLHPLDLETRVRRALEEVKPRLGQHGGSVQLLGVTPEGAVHLQLEGNCEGCPSSRMTLKFSIEEALYAAAPDITALEVNGLVEEHAPAAPRPEIYRVPHPRGSYRSRSRNRRKSMNQPPVPDHVAGTPKGEEQALHSKEPGRDKDRKHYQDARDSTGINAADRQPILPIMPHLPPA